MTNTTRKDNFRDDRAGLRDAAPSLETSVSPRSQVDRVKSEAPRRRFVAGMRSAKLYIPEEQLDPNFHYHWINDDPPGRINEFLYDGYEHVSSSEIRLLADITPANSDSGSNISRIVSRAGDGQQPVRAYLMKIPMDLYEERQALLQEPCDAVDRAIQEGRSSGQEDRNFYLPNGKRNKFE